ncbi:MAG: response regulator [Acidobacteria bacterium]|nr:MAG: response regulator [Acidobacteriota bacterium]MCE7957164.1 response regulator [Acidobacteria bacterium ACB2]
MHKILLVDDARNFLDLEVSFLRRAECQVLTAGTGLEAIRVARAESPDLIVLDIEMPEMNGLQACRILKTDPATQPIPVIVLTSMQMEDEARRAGAEHFLRKPIDEPRFLAEVRKFLTIEERQDPRVALDAPITFWRDGEPHQGRLLDLSKTGFFVGCRDPQPVGARLEVSFTLPRELSGKLITAEAMVVRQSEGDKRGFACRFFRLTSGARLFVEEFLERGEVR